VTDELLKWRSEFPILERKTHLISHSLGAMPRRARDRAKEFLDLWDEQGIVAWNTWLPYVTKLGDLVGSVIGADPGTIVMNQNVSTVQWIVSSCLDFKGPRRRVVYSDLNFHTVNYVWQEQARRRGAELVIVPSKDGIHPPTEEILAAIDERTAIVPISHVIFRSSAVKDVRAITKKAHEVGALVLLDCYQSTGTVPFSVKDLGVDFACGGSVKWICGGPGAAYLYVRPDRMKQFEPMLTGWFAHKRPFAFEMGPIDYADDVWRYSGGTPAMPALYTAHAGWEIVASIGVDRIREKSLRMTRRMMQRADEMGFRVNTPREDSKRGGTVCIDFDGAEVVSRELIRRGILLDYRPKCGIRASPHFYTTDEEVERLFEEIEKIRSAA